MAIAELQRRATEVGRIRLGTKVNGRQQKLDTFRFSSGAQHLIEEIAALYGGKCEPWVNGKKHLFEVVTSTNIIPIYFPPQTIDPFYEQWGGGVCVRRCDGIRDLVHDTPCDCAFDASGKPSKCKPTTRVNVMLADIQGLGVWRLETHGIYAAGEMVQLSERIAGIRMPLPARLYLEPRDGKKFNRQTGKVETQDYNVPVIMIDSVTSRHVQLGADAISQALIAGGHGPINTHPAIEAPSAPAIEAPKAAPQPQEWDPEVIRRGLAMVADATPERMADLRDRIVKMGRPPVLVQAWEERSQHHEAEAAEARRVQAQRPPLVLDGGDGDSSPDGHDDEWEDEMRQAHAASDEPPTTPPTAPPAASEPAAPTEAPPAQAQAPAAPGSTSAAGGDRQAAMTRLLGVAGQKGMKRAELDTHMQSQHDVGLKAATAEQLNHLAEWIGG